MEGVGARLGRSSTRYGPATVFTGPVRKWKKKWVHVSPSASNKRDSAVANGGSAGDVNNGSHLLLFKWTPLSESNNGSNGNGNGNGSLDKNSPGDDAAAAGDEPPRRRFKYVPIAFLEEQKMESPEEENAEKIDEEAKPDTTEASIVDLTTKKVVVDEKPDINDVPMEENQDENRVVRQDLNESTLDLSLNLNADDGEPEKEQST